MLINRRLALALAVAPLLLAPVVSVKASTEQTYYCQAGDITYVFGTPFGGMVEVEISVGETVDPSLAGIFTLQEIPDAGDVVLYSDGNYSVFERDTLFYVQEGDYDPFPCAMAGDGESPATAADQGGRDAISSLSAQSWGGNVRSGPGTQYRVTTSLPEGAPITLLENTGIDYNGYPWFEIAHDGGLGYHWGGIICGVEALIEGTFEMCDWQPD